MLAQAAGTTLGESQTIDYLMLEPDYEVRPMRKLAMAANCDAKCAGSYDMDITPDGITASDTVTMTWEIGG